MHLLSAIPMGCIVDVQCYRVTKAIATAVETVA